MTIFFVLICSCYVLFLLFLLFGFSKIKKHQINPQYSSEAEFSIVVPFRNEAGNLPFLLDSLSNLDYPPQKFEIILVNDASEDTSEEICHRFRVEELLLSVKILQTERNSSSPKKDALKTAINAAEKKYIITTDADCTVPENWLQAYDNFLAETNAHLVAGPVKIDRRKGGKQKLLDVFQELDFHSLQAATIGGFGVEQPFLCNGANLCYERQVFFDVNGFEGNEDFAGGDDVFLLQKFRKGKFTMEFLKDREVIVATQPQPDLRSLFEQRIRWAGKTSRLKSNFGKCLGAIVFLMNLILPISLILMLNGNFPENVLFLMFLFKFNLDFILIYKSAIFFEREKQMKNYFWCSFLYPCFVSAVGIISLFSGFSWKGRQFRR